MKKDQIPRWGYPRPQMVRKEWLCLNGRWDFAFDYGNSGIERRWFETGEFPLSIEVPFCPESPLSGIGNVDFMPAVWYRRTIGVDRIPEGERLLLHFGAVDYRAAVWVNGRLAGSHTGGYTPFCLDVTDIVREGENTLVVCAQDDPRDKRQPTGKQSESYYSHGCFYTRVTGIWQTVWLEHVPETYFRWFRLYPDYQNASVTIEAELSMAAPDGRVCARASFAGEPMGEACAEAPSEHVFLTVPLEERHGWGPGEPNLYDLVLCLERENGPVDRVESYFGLRTITLEKGGMRINGTPVYQRLVLDQGYYPDGVYTAPDDAALRRDIELALAMGFNGARLHEKVFDPRMLYWADRLGYLLWGEFGNWGLDITSAEGLAGFLPQWVEAVERDFNHPALVGWCPFNETWDEDITPDADGTVDVHRGGRRQNDETLRTVYQVTKALDGTRPVIDTSGNYHVVTDIYDIHDYTQDSALFERRYSRFEGAPYDNFPLRQRYGGQPYMVSEFGGIWWDPGHGEEARWGYGQRPQDEAEFLVRYRTMITALLENPDICGFCYTQLYDVEQEVNGLYTYDRRAKFAPDVIREINRQVSAMEQVVERERVSQ